jgi:hypothetical protein
MSAPHVNELLQPDETSLTVIVNGDDFYQRVEDLHGRIHIRDDEGWMCSASVNDDSTDFIPGERYMMDTAAFSAGMTEIHRELNE